MAEKRLEAYISEQENEYLKKLAAMEKRNKSFKIKLIIFGCIFIAALISAYAIQWNVKNSRYDEWKNAESGDAEAIGKIASSLEAISHPDIFVKYEMGYLGNRSLNSLNYGLIAENQYGYTTINDNGETVFHGDRGEAVIATETISQLHITKDVVIYRGADKKLYSCKHDGTNKKLLVGDRVGSVALVGDVVYYVNNSQAGNLYRYQLNDKVEEPVLEANVNQFVVLADYILYSDDSYHLTLQKIGGSTPSWTSENVAKFYFNGEVYVQNNDKIIKFNIRNHYPSVVATNVSELLGVDENAVYFTENNKLYAQNLVSKEKQELSYAYDYYKGVYSVNGKVTALGGVKE